MNDVLWVGAIVLLVAPGMIVWRVPMIGQMNRTAHIAFAWIAGTLITALLMYAYALAGVQWSRVNIAVPLIVLAIVSMAGFRRPDRLKPVLHFSIIAIAAFLSVTLYAIADARATCGDLLYIWGPKAQAFFLARTIDPAFLHFPFYTLMHPDYPPLVPLIYDVGSIFTHRFSWWGALYIAPLILLSIAGVVRGFGGSAYSAAGVFAVVSFGFVAAYLPGGADPFLLLFEAVAVIAVTFAPESRDGRWIAAVALAGAAFSKVEGATFTIIVLIAFVMTRRQWKAAVAMIVPAAALLATWLLFVWRHNLFDQYARARTPMYWQQLPAILSDVFNRASYHAWWIPWIAAIAPLFVHRQWRRAALPLLTAAGSLAATIFFYLHDPHPAFWIATSADRILVTPLLCVAIASVNVEPHVSSRAP